MCTGISQQSYYPTHNGPKKHRGLTKKSGGLLYLNNRSSHGNDNELHLIGVFTGAAIFSLINIVLFSVA